jgi:proteic killer suppression protein
LQQRRSGKATDASSPEYFLRFLRWQTSIDVLHLDVIGSFKHKGLRSLFEQDDDRRVRADQVDRLRLILSALDQTREVQDMNQPTFRLHPMRGNRKGVWAVTVRVNWRATFRFEGSDACDVDLEDYH